MNRLIIPLILVVWVTGCLLHYNEKTLPANKSIMPVALVNNCDDYLFSSNNNVAVYTNDCSHEQYTITYPLAFKVYEITAGPPLWFSTNSVSGPWISQGTNKWVLFWKDGERLTTLQRFYLKGNVQQTQYWTTNELYYQKYQLASYFN